MSQDNFSAQANYYTKYRPTYPDEMFNFILQNTEGRGSAWDCGTGNGQVAVKLAHSFGNVYASDISQAQLDKAIVVDNIIYTRSTAEQTLYEDNLFDLITVAQAIHWFDFDRFYKEVERTAKDKALLAVIGYGRVAVDQAIDKVINEFYKDMFSRYFSVNRRYVEQHYSTISFPFEEIPSPQFTSKFKWTLDDLHGYLYSWSAVQQFIKEEGADPTLVIMRELKDLWGELREVKFPIFMRLGEVKSI